MASLSSALLRRKMACFPVLWPSSYRAIPPFTSIIQRVHTQAESVKTRTKSSDTKSPQGKKTAPRPLPSRPFKLPEDLYPQFVHETWRSPRISARRAAQMRKEAIRNGTYGSYDPETGIGWDPSWDRSYRHMALPLKPPKGKRHEKEKQSRIEKIQKGLDEQDEKMEQHRKNRGTRRRKDSLISMLAAKEPWEKD